MKASTASYIAATLTLFASSLTLVSTTTVSRGLFDVVGLLDDVISPEAMYYVRPTLRLTGDAAYGFGQGFTGIDLEQPFYCLTEGLSVTL